jgi:hypothetical protein
MFSCPLYSYDVLAFLWLDCPLSSTVIALHALEENKRVHDKIEAMADLSQPQITIWTNRSKDAIVAKFKYWVGQVCMVYLRNAKQT